MHLKREATLKTKSSRIKNEERGGGSLSPSGRSIRIINNPRRKNGKETGTYLARERVPNDK